jgi:hypothetical protein
MSGMPASCGSQYAVRGSNAGRDMSWFLHNLLKKIITLRQTAVSHKYNRFQNQLQSMYVAPCRNKEILGVFHDSGKENTHIR